MQPPLTTHADSALPAAEPSPVPAAGLAAPVGPIGRRPLHEEVADRLRDWITEGRLPAGSRLNERVLCQSLGVSRTPLREALKVLAAQRLVDLHPNRGASVAAPSADDVRHLFELMAALEGLSGELAALRRDEAQLREIRALHFEMLAAHARADLPGYYRVNRAIHEAINRCARNPMLTQTYDSVNLRIQHLRFRSNFNRARWDAAVAEHQRMLEALASRDAAGLRRLLEQHLRSKLDAVLESLGPEGESASLMAPAQTGEPAGARTGARSGEQPERVS